MIKLVIFDLDGTLVDSATDISTALNYAIEPYGFEKLTVGKTVEMIGEGISKLIAKVLGDREKEIGNDVQDRFLRYYSEHLTDFSVLYPGVTETLQNLGSCKKAVISNKREGLSRTVLDQLHIIDYFDTVLGSDSVEERKPSPKPVLFLLKKFSLGSKEIAIVGDSQYDIEAGRGAGVWTVGVTYGYRERDMLKGADIIIERMVDLPAALKELEGRPPTGSDKGNGGS